MELEVGPKFRSFPSDDLEANLPDRLGYSGFARCIPRRETVGAQPRAYTRVTYVYE